MNEEKINQILKNQMTIMAVLRDVAKDNNKDGYIGSLNDKRKETNDLLNPAIQPTIKERTHDALSENDGGDKR